MWDKAKGKPRSRLVVLAVWFSCKPRVSQGCDLARFPQEPQGEAGGEPSPPDSRSSWPPLSRNVKRGKNQIKPTTPFLWHQLWVPLQSHSKKKIKIFSTSGCVAASSSMGKACAVAEVLQVVRHNKHPTTKVTGRNKVFWLHDRHQPHHSVVAQLLAVEEMKITQLPSAALLGIAASLLMNGVVDSEGTAKTGPRFRFSGLWSALLSSYE